jgi:hypothetical protein
MGTPLLANYQTAFLYPPNWLFLLAGWLGGDAGIAYGFTLLSVLHLAWAGIGMALLLRKLDFPWLAQIIGGIAFCLSGFFVARLGFFSMVWVGAWLPWVIFYAHRLALADAKAHLVPGLTISIAMQLLAGHAQLAWYSLLLCAGWVTAMVIGTKSMRKIASAWAGLVLAILLAVGIAAVQLVPTFEYLRNSQRADAFAYQEAMTYSFWPWRMLTAVSPDFFGSPGNGDYWGYASYWEDHVYQGVLPVLLAAGAIGTLAVRRRKPKLGRRGWLVIGCVGMLLVSLVLALGNNTPLFPFLYWHIPTFAMFQAPTRYMFWATFALPILAAVGVEDWQSPTGRGLYWFRLATAGAFAISLGAGLAWLLMHNIRLTFIRSTALTGFWGLCFGLLTLVIPLVEKKGHLSLWRAGVIAIVLVDLLTVGWSLNPGTGLEFYTRQVGGVSPSIQPENGRVYLQSEAEYDLKFHRFLRFKDFQPLEDWSGMRKVLLPNLNLLDGIALVTNFDPLVSSRYQRWLKELNQLSPGIRSEWLKYSFTAYEEKIDLREASGVRFNVMPGAQRWHWYPCAREVNTSEQAWTALQKEFALPPQADRQVIIETQSGVPPQKCLPGEPAQVVIVAEKPDQIILQVDAATSGWLEWMDSWYPGWTVSVSGHTGQLYPADYQFRAVYVEKGKHNVTFSYRPTGFYFGALFSILVLLPGMFLLLKTRCSP